MNLSTYKPKNLTGVLKLLITKNTIFLFKQTQTEAEETLKFLLSKPRESFSFYLPLQLGDDR